MFESQGKAATGPIWTSDENWWYGLRKSIGMPPTYQYLISLPPDYADHPSRRWPLIMFLHGSGARSDDQHFADPPLAGRRFPFILLTPQCPNAERWSTAELKDLIDNIKTKYRIDDNRVSVTGASRGGRYTWSFAMDYPDMVSAIAPVCGSADPKWVKRIKNVPVWAFHGDQDTEIPFAEDKAGVDALKKAGGNVKFTVYPGVGHNAWDYAYATDELYMWLMVQKRARK